MSWPILRSVTLDQTHGSIEGWPDATTFLIDAADPHRRGGTGEAVDWTQAATLARQHRAVLAGGLTPENVEEAIAAVQPYGVDVSSGVEDAPGFKNPQKVALFLANAQRGMARVHAGRTS